MRIRIGLFLVILFLVGLLISLAGRLSMADDSGAAGGVEFPQEAVRKWREYVTRVSRYEGTYRSLWRDVFADELLGAGQVTVRVSSSGWALSVGSREASVRQSGGHGAWGVNSRYSFRISRTEDGSWRIDDLQPLGPDAAARQPQNLLLPPENPVPSGTQLFGWAGAMRRVCQGLVLNTI